MPSLQQIVDFLCRAEIERKHKKREYYLKNRDKILEKQRLYRIENIEKIREQRRQYRKKNIDKVLARDRKNYHKFKEKYRERRTSYYLKNKDKKREYDIQYRLKNYNRIKEQRKIYRLQQKRKAIRAMQNTVKNILIKQNQKFINNNPSQAINIKKKSKNIFALKFKELMKDEDCRKRFALLFTRNKNYKRT